MNEHDWMDKAKCKGTSVNVFHPRVGESSHRALTLCRECAVVSDCLNFAIENRITEGIWGGMLETPRARFARQCRKTSC
jgi:WhiB family redox-sensing transcriptional regulator